MGYKKYQINKEACSTKPVLALILLSLLLVVSEAESASDYREVVQASEILPAIERGELRSVIV